MSYIQCACQQRIFLDAVVAELRYEEKAIDLFNLGIPTIEVDLSDMKFSFTPEMVRQRLLDGKKTSLIYSPKCKAIFAKWLLGEWKKVLGSSRYVQDCPFTRSKTYFLGVNNPGSRNECHECDAFFHYNGGEKLLCYGCVGGIDFSKIDKIEHLVKEENHLREVTKVCPRDAILPIATAEEKEKYRDLKRAQAERAKAAAEAAAKAE